MRKTPLWLAVVMLTVAAGSINATSGAEEATETGDPLEVSDRHVAGESTVSFSDGGAQPLVPARLMDTRAGANTIDGIAAGAGPLGPDQTTDLTVTGRGGVPAVGVGAVVLNVTAVDATAATFITIWPTGEPRPLASNLNPTPATGAAPNLVVAKVGTDGHISLYNLAGTTHLLADVVAWFPEGTGAQPLVPARLMDTRAGANTIDGIAAGAGPLGPDQTTDLTVTGRGGVPAVGVGAVVLNVTAVDATAATFITIWPTGEPRPLASNLNPTPATGAAPNLVVAKVGTDGHISLYNLAGTTHLLADVVAWFPEGTGAQPLVPARLMDTRAGANTIDGIAAGAGPLGPDQTTDLTVTGRGGVPAVGVGAVVLNVTAVDATAATFITIWPTGEPRPLASNLNPTPATGAAPNLVVAKVGTDGHISLYNLAGTTHLLADVVAWFPEGTGTTTLVVPPTTRLVGAGDVLSIVGDSNTPATVVLAPSADAPEPGGFLAILPHPAAPNGFVGAVTSTTSNADGTTTVATLPTTLGEAFTDVHTSFAGPMGSPFGGADVSVGGAAKAGLGSALDLGACSLPGLSVGGGLDVSGLDGRFELSLSEPRMVIEITLDLTLSASVAATAGISCSVDLDPPGWVPLGPVAQFNPTLVVSVSAAATITAQSSVTVPVTVGFDATLDGIKNLSKVDLSGTGDVTAPASASVEISALLTGEISALGRIGGSLGIGPVVRGEVTFNGLGDQACYALKVFGRASLDAKVDLWLKEWPVNLATFDTPSRTLFQGGECVDWVGTVTQTYVNGDGVSRSITGNYTMTINPDGRYKDGYIEADAVGSVLDDYATSGVCQQTSHFASSNIAGPQPANPDFPFVGVYIKVDPDTGLYYLWTTGVRFEGTRRDTGTGQQGCPIYDNEMPDSLWFDALFSSGDQPIGADPEHLQGSFTATGAVTRSITWDLHAT